MFHLPSVVDLTRHLDNLLGEKYLRGEDLLGQGSKIAPARRVGCLNHGFQIFHGEALHDADDPQTCGLPIYMEAELNALVLAADKAGLQIAAHAIGDKANTWILNALAQARLKNGVRDSRHRVEHAQVVRPEDVVRFRELGVIASIQPCHCIDDMRWAEKRIGSRVSNAYRFASFLKNGVHLVFGTDWDVEPLDPRLGIYAAVSREFPTGGPAGGWHSDEKLSLADAIEQYTLGSAYAEFQEKEKGSIAPGKWADLAVMEKDLFQIPQKEILKIAVVMTILAGKIIFKKN